MTTDSNPVTTESTVSTESTLDLTQLPTVHPEWAHALAPVANVITDIGDKIIEAQKQGHRILPAPERIFYALRYPIAHTRVLILGQDPYPTPGNANGMAFSVEPGVNIPASLRNIYTEMADDLGITPPTHGDLSAWNNAGIMLLNRHLSVQAGASNSHADFGWDQVTDHIIDVLCEQHNNPNSPTRLVAILWGRHAQQAQPKLQAAGITCITSSHPSPLSAHRGFFGSRPFSRANEALLSEGAEPVEWTIPKA